MVPKEGWCPKDWFPRSGVHRLVSTGLMIQLKMKMKIWRRYHSCCHHRMCESSENQLKDSFIFFMASALTVFEAGLALKTQGSLVNGLMPFFAGVAGFFFNFKFSIPPSLKFPFFLISAQATPKRASMTPFTCLFFKPH